MARLIYGLSGEGRGHTSRALAVVSELRRRGHEVRFCCGGVARSVLERRGEEIIPVPSLEYVLDGNQLQFWQTARNIVPKVAGAATTVKRLCSVFETFDPALLIADFEPFSTRAAEWSGVPVLSLTHPQLITETEYSVSPQDWLHVSLARLATHLIAPWRPIHVLITSFYHPPLRRPARTTLVPPILRSDVRTLNPAEGDHVLVYYNHGEGAGNLLRALKAAGQKAVIYGFPEGAVPANDPYLQMRQPSRDGFLEDLATSRAVISTAGFTLLSEALYLGKPVLAVPNQGLFEQTLNARHLERLGLGEWVEQENLTPDFIRDFLGRAEQYRSPDSAQVDCGTEEAVGHIEGLLRKETRSPVVSKNEPSPQPLGAAGR